MNKELLRGPIMRLHRAMAHLGLHVLPRHYYSAQADLAALERTRAQWQRPSEMVGVHLNVADQIEYIDKLKPFLQEPDGHDSYREALAAKMGLGFGSVEARFLYAVIRYLKPKKIVEVGGGVTTAVMQAAVRKNGQGNIHTVIEPLPSEELRRLESVRLIREPVQAAGFEHYTSLSAGDFLFIDSSHAVKPGSDVVFLVLEVLPRLPAGVVVHFHDIAFPYDYQPQLFQTLYQWSETALLHAFLINNCRCRVLLSLSYMHHRAPEYIRGVIPNYNPVPMSDGLFAAPISAVYRGEYQFPASTYLVTAGNPQ